MTGIGRSKKASAMLEYSVLSAVFVLAIVLTQVYVARAIKGKFKADTDSIGQQYSYPNSNYDYHQLIYSKRLETTDEEGQSTLTLLEDEVSGKTPYLDDFSDRPLVGENAERLFE